MPKTANIKKSSAAVFQNQKQIKRAYDPKQDVTFAAVEKCLGSAQFQLRLTGNKTAKVLLSEAEGVGSASHF
jgi:hypothetical protein